VILVLILAVGVASCSSNPTATPPSTSPPTAAAHAICAAVHQAFNAAPNESVALSLQTIAAGEQSGDSKLDTASRALLGAASQPGGGNMTAMKIAEQQVRQACKRLGIW
jgi:hypothetical protein